MSAAVKGDTRNTSPKSKKSLLKLSPTISGTFTFTTNTSIHVYDFMSFWYT